MERESYERTSTMPPPPPPPPTTTTTTTTRTAPSPPPLYTPSPLTRLLTALSTTLTLPLRLLSPPSPPLSHYTALLTQPSIYPLTPTFHTHTLPSNRTLSYTIFGSTAPNAKTIFYFHGFPGSSVEGASCHAMGVEMGVRLVCVDRPGVGWSAPVGVEEEEGWRAEMKGKGKGARLLGLVRDVEAVAGALEVGRFGVLGVSGGGPAALACAYHLPRHKLQVATLVCGMGPPDIGMRGADLVHRLSWPHMRWVPGWLIKTWLRFNLLAQPHLPDDVRLQRLLDPANFTSGMHPKDVEVLNNVDTARFINAAARHAYWQGFDGWVRDAKVSCSPFGFRVEDVRRDLPVRLWYGTLDVYVPPVHGKTLAERLGGRDDGVVRLELLEETHASIFFKRREEALRDMVECMERAEEAERRGEVRDAA